MRKIAYFLSGLISLMFIGIVGLSYYVTQQVLFFKLRDVEVIIRRETRAKRMDINAFKKLPQEVVDIDSKFGYKLNTIFITPNETNKWVVICHGVTENKISMVKYVNLFTDMGYNCVIFDARRHGDSGGLTSTYGYYEKFDLESVIDYLIDDFSAGQDIEVGVHGESMGAATMLLYAGELSNRAKFYISNASFSTFEQQLLSIFNQKSKLLAPIVLKVANVFFHFRSKFSVDAVNPEAVIHKIEQPILFIHSKPDKFISVDQTKRLYELKRGPKASWYPERGGHVESYNRNPKTYKKKIEEFLTTYAGW
ncbi:MAG TPA: alpha/beta hydrolase [Aliicoccus persicus]|uniref:Alpha/beta hydrolase n=1 Tax=Aliicoccus persicus TaxID=930138 RepID=A0A921JBS7_9STAP|nr:alpha/beta hydrolase [Aliicoccus persicus]